MTDRNSGPTELTLAGTYSGEVLEVTIPQRVGAEIERRVAATEFDSTDAYVTFVLQSLLRQFEQQDDVDDASHTEQQSYTEEHHTEDHDDSGQSELLQERLESLGYL